MKNSSLKLLEIIIQIFPLLVLIILFLFDNKEMKIGGLIFYFGGGSIQFLSLLIHLIIKKHWKNLNLRKIYSFILISIFLILAILALTPAIIIGLFGLLVVSPLLYIFYLIITINEYNMAVVIEEKGFLQI